MRKLAIAIALLSLAASKRHIAGRGVPDPPFGVFVNVAARPDANTLGRALDLAQADGIGWIRIQFAWSTIQPAVSAIDFRLYDQVVARAKQDNLHILGILGYATSWNTTAPATELRVAQRLRYPPSDYDAWSRFVFTTVTQYKNTVHHWEIWNKPDVGTVPDETHTCNGYWCGTAAQYAQLLSVAYKAVKAADPSATVLLGGLALGGAESNQNFLFDILTDPANPATNSFDVMNFHVYGNQTEALRRMNFVKSQLAFGGAGTRPIWITEFGYPSDASQQTVAPYLGGEAAQASYLKDMAAYLFNLGARKLFWYQLFDVDPPDPFASYGLLTTTFAKKPSYTAMGDAVKTLP